ncbi:MAG: hypothetical protein IJP74_07795 [Prevotella sp.]|nr:hypothetical protein [Prevotella sp.]
MKKTTYTKPKILVVRLQAANQMLTVSGSGRAVNSVSNSEGFSFDSNGVDDTDDLR